MVILLVSLTRMKKYLPAEKCYTDEWDYYSIYKKHVIKETGRKVGCFAGFCHHCLTAMSAQAHAYRYPLFEVERRHVQV